MSYLTRRSNPQLTQVLKIDYYVCDKFNFFPFLDKIVSLDNKWSNYYCHYCHIGQSSSSVPWKWGGVVSFSPLQAEVSKWKFWPCFCVVVPLFIPKKHADSPLDLLQAVCWSWEVGSLFQKRSCWFPCEKYRHASAILM